MSLKLKLPDFMSFYPLWGIGVRCALVILLQFFVFIPFMVQSYVPVLMPACQFPFMWALGMGCAATIGRTIGNVVVHLLLSIISLGFSILAAIEYFTFLGYADALEGEFCFPGIYGCAGATFHINMTAANTQGSTEAYLATEGMLLIMCVWSFMEACVSIGSICIYVMDSSVYFHLSRKEFPTYPTLASKGHCFAESIFVFCDILFVSSLVEWVFALIYYFMGDLPANPLNYHSAVFGFISIALLNLPFPRLLREDEDGNFSKLYALLLDESKDDDLFTRNSPSDILRKIPLDACTPRPTSSYVYLYCFMLFYGICLSFVDFLTMAFFLIKNNAHAFNYDELSRFANETIYYNFTNVAYVQYIPQEQNLLRDPGNAIANSTIVLEIMDLIMACFAVMLFPILALYAVTISIVTWTEEGEEM